MNEEKPVNSPVWEIEETHPQYLPALEEALNEIMDPELGLSKSIRESFGKRS